MLESKPVYFLVLVVGLTVLCFSLAEGRVTPKDCRNTYQKCIQKEKVTFLECEYELSSCFRKYWRSRAISRCTCCCPPVNSRD
ncbi:hypothetical protein ScPMuIL_004158 [Solemya velum]